MAKEDFNSKIYEYSVRIGLHNAEKKLLGSGVLLPMSSDREIYVLTAAHVAEVMKSKLVNEKVSIDVSGKDTEGNNYSIIFEAADDIHIHSKYEYHKDNHENHYLYDAAIFQITSKPWMKKLPGYYIEKKTHYCEVAGYGFPESLDAEGKVKGVGLTAGVKAFTGEVQSNETGRNAIGYAPDNVEDLGRSMMMLGFSGTGLFSTVEKNIILQGIISCERGKKSSGTQLWATDAETCLEVIEQSGITFGCPESFKPYIKMVEEDFGESRKNCKRKWITWANGLLSDGTIIPNMFQKQADRKLRCEGNRRSCHIFWKEKLKELVVLYGVQGLSKEELKSVNPIIPLSDLDGDNPHLEFVCTEESVEVLLGNLIHDCYFSSQGDFYDGTIILLNRKDSCNDSYTRRECRNIIENIAGEYIDEEDLLCKADHLLSDEAKKADFNIITGAMRKCNIAAMGSGKLMEVLNREMPDKMKKKLKDILEELWEEE